jgi:microcystin-dependent protein
MSTCSNCYNGCTEIVSDRCVRYTGIDVPVLGIQTGDSLSYVEQALITFLTSTLDGTGIKLDIPSSIICEVVNKYLPTCRDINVLDLSIALIKAACDLQNQINDLDDAINVIEAPYTVNCLTGVTSTSGTHALLQATIDSLCTLRTSFNALLINIPNTYVAIDDLDQLIQDYLDSIGVSTLIKNRMVPYSAVPYYGPLTYFDGTGSGTGDWVDIYLCNGLNGTPDLRGRTLVGVTDGTMLGGTMDPQVIPTTPGNPTYSLGTTQGTNQVTLGVSQIPAHTHVATVSSIPNHAHYMAVTGLETNSDVNSLFNGTNPARTEQGLIPRALPLLNDDNFDYELVTVPGTPDGGKTSEAGAHTHSVDLSSIGGGLPHSNIQPSSGCLYIIYIP